MPAFRPISRRDFIDALRSAGFEGPYSGQGKHPAFMVKGTRKIKLPNPHAGDIGRELLGLLLKQAGLSKDEWEKL